MHAHSFANYCSYEVSRVGQLKEIQENLQLPVHHLKCDEPTGWNDTLYMLQVLIGTQDCAGFLCCDIVPLTSDVAAKVVS